MKLRGSAALGLLAAVVAGTAAVPLWVNGSGGVDDLANHPVVVLPMAASALSLLLSATCLRGAELSVVRRWLAATGTAMYGYLALTAVLAWRGGHLGIRDGFTEVLVASQGIAWAPPIALLGITFLSGLAALNVSRRSIGHLIATLVVFNVVALPIAWVATPPAPDSPYAGLPPLWDSPAMAVVTTVLLVPWMLVIPLAPVVAWRAVATAPRAVRGRVLAIALASMTPTVTIIFCLAATLLVLRAGVLSAAAGGAGLAVAYFLPMVLCGPVLVQALRSPGMDRLTTGRTTLLLSAVVGAPLVIVTVTFGWLLAEALGGRGLAIVIVATLALGALASASRRWLVRALVLRVDPARGRAAALVAAYSTETGDAASSPARALQRLVQQALGRPDAVVSVLLPQGDWVHVDGTPAARPMVVAGQSVHVEPHHEDSSSVLEEVEPLVDRARLELTVRAQDAVVAEAEARTRTAASAERRRLERDLHDGVQGRLLALALDLRVAQHRLPSGEANLVIADAVEALAKAISELRALSRGTGSEVLSHRGLRAAVSEFAGRMPLPVSVIRAPDRLPPVAQSVVYLVVCEAVTNAVKHARATGVEVDIDATDGNVMVAVADDGIGGADLRLGAGLQGLAERVSSVGGQLVVSDRQPHGTLVEVVVPCES